MRHDPIVFARTRSPLYRALANRSSRKGMLLTTAEAARDDRFVVEDAVATVQYTQSLCHMFLTGNGKHDAVSAPPPFGGKE